MDGLDLGGYGWLNGGAGRRFDDPFLVPSSNSIPRTLENALDMCFFLYYMNPNYASAAGRVARHFITDFDFPGDGSKEEKEDMKDFVKSQLQMPLFLTEMGDEWACLAGATKVPTRDGVFAIRDLVGKQVDVISKDGVYRPAKFKSYGRQELLEVEFSDGRKVMATPEHEWEVKNCSGKIRRVKTRWLSKGNKVERTVAPRPERNADYYEGVRHGFIFGDGSLACRGKKTEAVFCGKKDEALVPFFKGLGNALRVRPDKPYKCLRQSGFPAAYKELPARDKSASYWYGFVSGFLAADGSVDIRDGCAILTQHLRNVLEAIEEQLPRIGMVGGSIRSQTIWTVFNKGKKNEYRCYGTMYYMTLLQRFMQTQDFLIPAHAENFDRRKIKNSKYGRFIQIRAIRKTGKFEEVFCCEEMQTHTFVVENGILTGNCYGNCFCRIHFPFDRFLVDKKNSKFYALEFFGNRAKFNWSKMTYTVPNPMDPKGNKIDLPFIDRKSTDITRIRLRRLHPRYMTILHDLMSGFCRYVYRFETWFLDDIKKGRLHVVNNTPIEMLEAVRKQQDFLFDEGTIFHLKSPTISGVSMADWGMPPTIANYRNIYQIQIYRKADEAVGMDYLLPFRLFSPAPQSNNDMNSMMNNVLMGRWNSEIRQIIANRRKDKFAMHALPFPVNYMEFGADWKKFSPKELIEYQTGQLYDGMGFPQELFKGTLSYQQVPTAMRIFENSFRFLGDGFSRFSQWALTRIQAWRGQQDYEIILQRPQMADSIERKQLIFQLGAMGEISRATAWETLGIDNVKHEMTTRMEEDIDAQRKQLELQTQLQQQTEAGSLLPEQTQPQGGAPGSTPPPSGPQGVTPGTQSDKANELAQYWLSLPVGERSKAMAAAKSSDEDLYALAMMRKKQMESQGASQGRSQVAQQAQQQVSGQAPGGQK